MPTILSSDQCKSKNQENLPAQGPQGFHGTLEHPQIRPLALDGYETVFSGIDSETCVQINYRKDKNQSKRQS